MSRQEHFAAPGGIGVWGIGVALPPHVRDNSFWDEILTTRDEQQRRGDALTPEKSSSGAPNVLPKEVSEAIHAIGDDKFRGARLRHVLEKERDISDLEAEAGRAALEDAGVAPDEIDLVLVHSLVPDRLIPSNAPAVQDKLGLTRAVAWSLDVGCASFQAHFLSATALIRSGMFRRVLIVQSHVGSRSVHPQQAQAPNFGDAATAAVLGEVPAGFGLLGHYSRTDGSFRDGIVLAPVRDGVPLREWWNPRDGIFQLASFDPDIGKSAGIRAPEFCREACFHALADARLELSEIDLYVGNQSLGWFVDACRRALGLSEEKVVETFARIANVGDAAILANLNEARRQKRLRHGDKVLVYSPSAGFTRSAVVIRWWEKNPREHM